MGVSLAPSDSDIFAVLRSFLLAILPSGVEVVQAQDNRVPEPQADDFVSMNAIRRPRLSTNLDSEADVSFTGSIADDVLTVTDVACGTIALGATVFGIDVAAGTVVMSFGTGHGGTGTYTVLPEQTIGPGKLSSGASDILQPVDLTVQLDVHGPNGGGNAQIISTLFRDTFAVDFFAAREPDVAPLYADDPRQLPFQNDQQQIETRWIVEAHLQANQTVTVPQQYADTAAVTIVSVDATYPPS